MLKFLYKTFVGRVILQLLCMRWVSVAVGKFLDSRLSKIFVKGFVRRNNIDLSEYYSDSFRSFNDCFTRQIKEGKRPISYDPCQFISPCDGLLSIYNIDEGTKFCVKGSSYTVSSLLNNPDIAKEFCGGTALVFRLCVSHYHRYIYIDNAEKSDNVFIKGKLHTVRPIALENVPVFKENCREYTVLDTENFGKVVQIEVGAMLVGKIKNHHGKAKVLRGEEKGMFLYGGSTVILLVKKDALNLRESLLPIADTGREFDVLMGECLGRKNVCQNNLQTE